MSDSEARPARHVFERIRSRRLVQWGLGYLAGAWLVLQVAELLADIYAWPDTLLRAAVPLLVLGLAATLILAWFHGEKGNQRVTAPELALLAAVAIAGLVVVTRTGPPIAAAGDEGSGEATASSVAVLPFVNMSPDPDQEYFSDGVTEELLHALAQIPGLYVPARTSSFAFKGVELEMREIARRLGVAHVLAGSVRTAGDQVRVTAQLVNARTGGQMWSDTYDRRLEDIFGIQEDIARAIVAELRSRLDLPQTADDALTSHGTSDLEAYQAYLRGLAAFNSRRNAAAVRELEHSVALDPGFAKAHAALSASYAAAYGAGASEVEGQDARRRTEESARRALELDPALAVPHSSLGLVYTADRRWAEAEVEHRAAVAAEPSSADAQHWLGWHLVSVGRLHEALEHLRQATRLDPLAPTLRRNYGTVLLFVGEAEEALRELERVDSLTEGRDYFAAPMAVVAAVTLGDTAGARASIAAADSAGRLGPLMTGALAMLGDTTRAASLLAERRESGATESLLEAVAYAAIGDEERAIDLIELAFERREPMLFFVLRSPALDRIRAHQRVRSLLQRAGLSR